MEEIYNRTLDFGSLADFSARGMKFGYDLASPFVSPFL
jgi:hypothetical protein